MQWQQMLPDLGQLLPEILSGSKKWLPDISGDIFVKHSYTIIITRLFTEYIFTVICKIIL
jgi:hypothetical protein